MKLKTSKKELREFGFVFGIGLPLIFGFLIPYLTGHENRFWTLLVSFPFIFIAIFKPQLLMFFYKLWMKIGFFLGWINSRIILGIVYVIVLLPISFIAKLFGYDPLRINKDGDLISYKEYSKEEVDLTKIF